MANKLNTVAKGDAFEDKVFCGMKKLLESEMLGLSPKHSKIFQKKAYLGKTGNKIIFDIAIESYHPDSEECSTLTLIECKDYKTPIQVDKIRNFASSINDVGGNKGYFITTSHFQRGAVNHAKSYKIGLAKFNTQKLEIEKWELRRTVDFDCQRKQAIQDELYCTSDMHQNSFVAICGSSYYSNFIEFIAEQFTGKPFKIKVAYLTNDNIKSIVSDLVTKMKYQPNSVITTDFLVEIVSKELDLKLIYDQPLSRGGLGICNFSERTICISSELKYDSPRWRFTLAHEIGHYILHERICSNNKINSMSDNEMSLDFTISNASIKQLEIQANMFASNLLIPEDLFLYAYILKHKQLGLTKYPSLYLDKQPCNIHDCLSVFSYLGEVFNISNEVVKIKLKGLGFLTVKEETKRLRGLVS